MIGASDDDCRILISKRFVLTFESGIIVIKHWKIHNYIAKDRYTETKYKEEKSTLVLDENKAYTQCIHNCIQDVDESETQVRLGKYSKDKYSINNEQISKEFDVLWKMYPNKKGKDKALSYYQKARKSGTTFEEVEQGIKNYCKEIQVKQTSTQYIKHGSTWFNNKGWLDNYDFTFDASANKSTSKFGYVPDDGSDLPY